MRDCGEKELNVLLSRATLTFLHHSHPIIIRAVKLSPEKFHYIAYSMLLSQLYITMLHTIIYFCPGYCLYCTPCMKRMQCTEVYSVLQSVESSQNNVTTPQLQQCSEFYKLLHSSAAKTLRYESINSNKTVKSTVHYQKKKKNIYIYNRSVHSSLPFMLP